MPWLQQCNKQLDRHCRYHNVSDQLVKVYLVPGDGAEPVPVSALINGIGQGSCKGSKCSYAVVPAVNGSCASGRTKLRLINTAGFAVFYFSAST